MAKKLVATGCRECNGYILEAEVKAPRYFGYVGTDEWHRMIGESKSLMLDGENMEGQEVYAAVVGSPGYLLKNAISVNFAPFFGGKGVGRHSRAHLCSCGSQLVEVELWEGDISLEVKGLAKI